MTTYQQKRIALEQAIIDILCNCGCDESCGICEHLSVCAMARRTKRAIADDKRLDQLSERSHEFAQMADNCIRGLFTNDT